MTSHRPPAWQDMAKSPAPVAPRKLGPLRVDPFGDAMGWDDEPDNDNDIIQGGACGYPRGFEPDGAA